MQTKTKVLITFIITIILVTGLYSFTDWFSKVTGYFAGEDEKTKVAYCLEQEGAEFYGSVYCSECEKQAELFGTAFKQVKYIDCGKDKSLCPNIRSVPSWYINKTIYYGYKNLTELKYLSNCD
ncbi:MAG: hypothetical protein Q7S74_03485 [Nanoarchaeota archaeon]|nr:hypothetical protein [Nanoarchaeota archaeon]